MPEVESARPTTSSKCIVLFYLFFLPCLSPFLYFLMLTMASVPSPLGFLLLLVCVYILPRKSSPERFFFSFSSSPLLSFVFLFFSRLLHRHHLSSLFSSLFSFFINNKHPLSSVDPLSLSSLLSFFLSVFLSFLKKKRSFFNNIPILFL
ncbi:hypothetical protein BKA57DRAFT_99724 [Linnemannia elongata]|nr:hypothetical protein BKA57DRAFT_99724 [Linnemannia elongata]